MRWKIVWYLFRYLLYPLLEPIYRQKAEEYYKSIFARCYSEEDSVTKALHITYISKKRIRRSNITVKLPILVECLNNEKNIQKISIIVKLLYHDPSVKQSVKLFPSPSLIQWIETFCDFANIYDSDKKLKKRTEENLEVISGCSLTLLDFALYRFKDIDKQKQEELAMKVTDTFAKTLQRMPNKLSELPGLSFQRIVASIPDLMQYIEDHTLKHKILDEFAELIPIVIRNIVEGPRIETAQIMLRLCEKMEGAPSELYKICRQFDSNRGCLFIYRIIENTISLPKYQEILDANPEDALIIAGCISKLISECSALCEKNSEKPCDGITREFLRYWLHYHTPRLLSKNKKEVHEQLTKSLVAIEKRTIKSRQFRSPGRPLLNIQSTINNLKINALGTVRHVSENGALFECTKDFVDNVRQLLELKDNQLEFTANIRITKAINEIVEYEPLKNPNEPDDPIYIFGIHLSAPLSDSEFEECKKHAKSVLI